MNPDASLSRARQSENLAITTWGIVSGGVIFCLSRPRKGVIALSIRPNSKLRELHESGHTQEQLMGAKTWMLVYADLDARQSLCAKPKLDRGATLQLAKRIFVSERLEELGDGDLSFTSPPDDELHIGCFEGVAIVAAKEFGIDYPSTLPHAFLDAGGAGKTYLHAMHSVVDWFAFAIWWKGKLIRSLSLSPDSGILEDIGDHLPFEVPFWSGLFPAVEGGEEYTFPFHPLELGEATLHELFGYQLEGFTHAPPPPVEAESIPLIRYKRLPLR